MTRKAIFQGREVTPEQFDALAGIGYKEKGLFPLCPVCDVHLSVYGVHSPGVTSRFDHPNFSDCALSSSPNPRYAHLHPEGWDLEAGQRLKAAFCEDDALKEAYAVCRALSLGCLGGKEFVRFCVSATRHRVWNYKNLPLWAVPYLLVTLADLQPSQTVRHALRSSHTLRFVLEKPKKKDFVDVAWLAPEQCRLVCVFADTGNRVKAVEPVMLRAARVEAARADTAWISPSLLAVLRECCLSQFEPPCGCGNGGAGALGRGRKSSSGGSLR
jgi:hypothetical protein